MAVKAAGLDAKLGLPGLTVILALVAFWLGTRKPGASADFPRSLAGSLVLTGLLVWLAFWLGARNPDTFGGLPIIGKMAD